jgi:hypothetical protein
MVLSLKKKSPKTRTAALKLLEKIKLSQKEHP